MSAARKPPSVAPGAAAPVRKSGELPWGAAAAAWTRLIGLAPDEIQDGLLGALGSLGEHAHADRAFILVIDARNATATALTEWARPGVAARGLARDAVSMDASGGLAASVGASEIWFEARLGQGKSNARLPRELSGSSGPRSAACFPMWYAGKPIGALCLLTEQHELGWQDDLAALVQLAAAACSCVLAHQAKDRDLRDRDETLRATIEAFDAGMMVANADGQVTHCNRRFELCLGLGRSACLGLPARRVLQRLAEAAENPAELLASVDRDQGSAGPSSHAPLALRDGRVFEWSDEPLELEGGPAGHVWRIRDVTERLALEAQLRQAQKLEAVGQLAGGIAHDFNNILFTISSTCELVMLRGGSGLPFKKELQDILGATHRASGLMRQLLAFSRKQLLTIEPVDLNQILADLGRIIPRVLGENIGVLTDFDPALRWVKADRSQLELVVLNLALHGRDAMPKGGSLTFETRNEVVRPDAASALQIAPGRYARLSVSDTGPGMDEATKARIFEPFFTSRELRSGSGLGLATVYGIVKQHAGHIVVRTSPGAGTTFDVFLPVIESPTSAAGAAEYRSETASQGETVLVVEDEGMAREVACRALRAMGYRVLAAADGTEAIQIATEFAGPIHLLLTDVLMPGMTGTELYRRLAEAFPDLRVLYMSGHPDEVLVRHGDFDPETSLLHKPFSLRSLAARVRTRLG